MWRIARTVTEENDGTFVRADIWGWDPVYSRQPYIGTASDHVRRIVETVRHRATGALCQVVFDIRSDIAQGRDGAPGRAAVSIVFRTALIGGVGAADANDELRALAGSAPAEMIDEDNWDTVTSLEIGISAAGNRAAARRSYLPQVTVGDVVTVYEDAMSWADYWVVAAPASIADDARTVTLTVRPIEMRIDASITGACLLGFSRAPRGRDGEDAEEGVGVEYIFASSEDGAEITGAANLPDPDWDYDAVSVAGTARGDQTYYDGTPADLSVERPYQIRFHRAVPGAPDAGDDIGTVEWVQESAVRVRGEQGVPGTGTDYTYNGRKRLGTPSQVQDPGDFAFENHNPFGTGPTAGIPTGVWLSNDDDDQSARRMRRHFLADILRPEDHMVYWQDRDNWMEFVIDAIDATHDDYIKVEWSHVQTVGAGPQTASDQDVRFYFTRTEPGEPGASSPVVELTEAQYDDLDDPDEETIYLIS